MTLILGIAAFLVLLILVMIFAAVSAILHQVTKAADDMHVTRAGVNSIRPRVRAIETVIDRLETHIRGPGRRPIKPAATAAVGNRP